MKAHNEHAKAIGIAGEYDVVVVGGGPAGAAAALASARNGAKTLVIEQFNCLGGVATAGGHGHFSKFDDGEGKRVVNGIASEFADRLVREGFGEGNPNGIMFQVEGFKLVLDQMAGETPGLDVLYHTFFCETIVEDGKAVGVIVQNKDGRQAVLAKQVIDCTGDGDAAASAGCPWEMGRAKDSKCQPVTLMFTIGGVDWERVKQWRTNYHMRDVWEEAQRNGDMEPFQKTLMGFWWTATRPDQVGVNFTHVTSIDSTKAADLTKATMEARRQAYQSINVFRKYVPGMENCHMASTPNTIGIRESRRIMGEYLLTEADLRAQRDFDDNIGYGCFFFDLHNLDGPGMEKVSLEPQPCPFKYGIPYRILVPLKVDNILTAGRCVSVTHIALGSLRVMVQCMAMGEAAGTAAALAVQLNTSPRQLPAAKVREQLRKQGAIVCKEDLAFWAGQPWKWALTAK